MGTLMMIPLRRSLIVKEHGVLPYPEGTACASVLKAGEKGGELAMTAILGVIVAGAMRCCKKYFTLLKMYPILPQSRVNKIFPSARIAGEITPEYMGVGYIIGPKIAGVLVAGGILSWFVFIPLLASLISPDLIAAQLAKLGYLADITKPGGRAAGIPLLIISMFGLPPFIVHTSGKSVQVLSPRAALLL